MRYTVMHQEYVLVEELNNWVGWTVAGLLDHEGNLITGTILPMPEGTAPAIDLPEYQQVLLEVRGEREDLYYFRKVNPITDEELAVHVTRSEEVTREEFMRIHAEREEPNLA